MGGAGEALGEVRVKHGWDRGGRSDAGQDGREKV